MSKLEYLIPTLLIANLRALCHEITRLRATIAKLAPEDDLQTELGLYLQDLLDTLSIIADEYEARRQNNASENDLTQVDLLCSFFDKETL